MARHAFGGDLQALAVDSDGNAQTGITLTAWTAQTGGTQVTDLTDTLGSALVDGNITTDSAGYFAFNGPDDTTSLWIAPPTGARRELLTRDLPDLIATAQAAAEAAAAAGVPDNSTPDLILSSDGSTPLWRTRAALDLLTTSESLIYGEDGRVYTLVSGVLRNDGTGWDWIDDTGHRPTGFDLDVVTGSDHVEITYSAAAGHVSSLQVTPDETYAAMGLRCGASVGLTSTKIYLYLKPADRISDYVTYTQATTTWASLNGNFTDIAYASGTSLLTLNHESMGTDDGIGAQANGRGGTINPQVEGCNDTKTTLTLYTMAGAAKGALAADVKLWVTRFGRRAVTAEDPDDVSSAEGNLWVTGLMETT